MEEHKEVNRIDLIKDDALDNINIKGIKGSYQLVGILFIVYAIIGIIFGFILVFTATTEVKNGYYYDYITNYGQLIAGILTIILTPLTSGFLWIIIRPIFAFIYDIKLIKYKLLYDMENKWKETSSVIIEEQTIDKPIYNRRY